MRERCIHLHLSFATAAECVWWRGWRSYPLSLSKGSYGGGHSCDVLLRWVVTYSSTAIPALPSADSVSPSWSWFVWDFTLVCMGKADGFINLSKLIPVTFWVMDILDFISNILRLEFQSQDTLYIPFRRVAPLDLKRCPFRFQRVTPLHNSFFFKYPRVQK